MHNIIKIFEHKYKNLFFILIINKNIYLSYPNKTYIHYKNSLFHTSITTAPNTLSVFSQNIHFSNQKFAYNIDLFFKKNIQPFTKKLILKGLGLKSALKDNILELKLGYSNTIKIDIPKNKILIKIFKNTLIISSSNLAYLGAFVYKIKKLKMPNIYKGKGIWYKHEKLKLKAINK